MVRTAALRVLEPTVPVHEPPATITRIMSLMRGFSIGVAHLAPTDAVALRATLPSRTPIYLTDALDRPFAKRLEQATRLRTFGFEPVPHLAARHIASAAALNATLAQFSQRAGVRRVLIIAGDRDRPAGLYASAIDLIDSGLLLRHGIDEIGIAGYPQGHPKVSSDALDRALQAKVDAAAQTGLRVHIVSQLTCDSDAIIAWIARLRGMGIDHPVRIGMAGPVSLARLLQSAHRYGVQTSAQMLTRSVGFMKQRLGTSAPDGMIRRLADISTTGSLGEIVPHFYAFGGMGSTARWAAAAATGRITLDRADGFRAEPP